MNLIDSLHKLNLGIVNSMDFYNINYIVAILISLFFIYILFKTGLKTLKDVAINDKLYLRAVILMVIMDVSLSTFFFFYEIFYNKNILAATSILRVTMLVLISSGGWICLAYNMINKSKKNPYIGMQMYLPMLSLLAMVYMSHIHIYSMLDNIVSRYVIFFWEVRAIITIISSFIRSLVVFIKSVSSSTDILIEKAHSLEDDLK